MKNPDDPSGYSSARNRGGKKPVSSAALANESQRINIPLNVHAWDMVLSLTDDDRLQLRLFHQHCLDRNLSLKQVAQILAGSGTCSTTTATRLLKGTYTSADWSGWVDRMRAYLATVKTDLRIGGVTHEPDFVVTGTAERFLLGLEYAGRGGISILVGASGVGKSKTLREWDSRNPGRLIEVLAPNAGRASALLQNIAMKIGVRYRKRTANDLQRAIEGKLSPHCVLVIEQASRLIPAENKIYASSLECLMDLSEISGCGIVLPVTFRAYSRTNELTYQIEQVLGRAEVFAAKRITLEDVEAIAAQFGNFSPRTIQALHSLALGPKALRDVTKVLSSARDVATLRRGEVTDALIATAIRNRRDRETLADPNQSK